MAAPSAPSIIVHQDGTRMYVHWQPVAGATDYKLYLQEPGLAETLETQVGSGAINADGWFMVITGPAAGVVNVRLTALNVLAEESASSNIVQKNLRGAGAEVTPTGSLNAHRRGAHPEEG